MESDFYGTKYVLHLFAGAGGGILGSVLAGQETVGGVEIEAYQRAVLLRRQADGVLPVFPLWDDVRSFRVDNPETKGYIEFLREIRDQLTVAGGFPCQDISIAGRGEGLDGMRSGLWVEFARIIGEIRPKSVFVENSAMLPVRGLDRVLGDLTQMGYDCKWGLISASDCTAPHVRQRFWLKAVDTHADSC